MRRFGLDVDGHSGLRLLMAYLNARRFGEARCYYTRRGFHVDVELEDLVSVGKLMDVRRALGDDPMRLRYDEWKLELGLDHLVDTLFEVKEYPDGVTYRRWGFDPLEAGRGNEFT